MDASPYKVDMVYLPPEFHILLQGDLHQYLKEKGALSPLTAVNFALDIARYSAFFLLYPFTFIEELQSF